MNVLAICTCLRIYESSLLECFAESGSILQLTNGFTATIVEYLGNKLRMRESKTSWHGLVCDLACHCVHYCSN